MKNIISLKNVCFNYEDTPVLENVDLNVDEGDFLGIIGPNGGGKTTLLKLILGLLSPKSGSVKVFNEEPKNVSKKIGYVPQAIHADKNFPITVFETVLLGSISKASLFDRFSKEIRKKALDLLEKIQIAHLKDKTFGYLSGGEKQKVLIARALLCDPAILILDEPTANIDIKAEKNIFDLLLKENKTVLMVSHDLEVIIDHVKKIIFVQKSLETKLPEEVCEHFALGLYHKPLKKEI